MCEEFVRYQQDRYYKGWVPLPWGTPVTMLYREKKELAYFIIIINILTTYNNYDEFVVKNYNIFSS